MTEVVTAVTATSQADMDHCIQSFKPAERISNHILVKRIQRIQVLLPNLRNHWTLGHLGHFTFIYSSFLLTEWGGPLLCFPTGLASCWPFQVRYLVQGWRVQHQLRGVSILYSSRSVGLFWVIAWPAEKEYVAVDEQHWTVTVLKGSGASNGKLA